VTHLISDGEAFSGGTDHLRHICICRTVFSTATIDLFSKPTGLLRSKSTETWKVVRAIDRGGHKA